MNHRGTEAQRIYLVHEDRKAGEGQEGCKDGVLKSRRRGEAENAEVIWGFEF